MGQYANKNHKVSRKENLSTEFPAQTRSAADESDIHTFWKPSGQTDFLSVAE
jgi:hypothetical protein